MSYSAERWARSQKAGNARAKAVLIELAHCLNRRTGQCTPSVAYLSRVTELKPDTITRATNDLQAKGLIKKTVLKTKTGRSCSYVLVGFSADEWKCENEDLPENEAMGNPKNEDTPKNGDTPENGVIHTPENGVTHTPENGDRTGNKNREIEQGIRTENYYAPEVASGSVEPLEFPALFDDLEKTKQETQDEQTTKVKKPKTKRTTAEKPDDVSEDVWTDFKALRTAKRSPITSTALNLIRKEAEKAGITLENALSECCSRGWQGFKASWLSKVNGNNYRMPQNVTQTPEYRERLQACCRGEGRTEKLADDGVTIIVD